ncbi:Phox homologous domain [Plasmopara halstedii]|uniref:Phox homologous domain n=1 Tax=Plasmopara halstedii TaxID=4781 RepID=A0A0P1AAC1_PLAHL|nr:Phox homologous domain [Plasmopara halstedii]CEG37536.1 Phox homologous domain [Plasmopara halstedii]|eukprot:XP_024573905.1 Phox homologous domain [Plasmopara halstedii]
MRVAVHTIREILQVRVHVAGSQFDRSLMPQPEFLLSTAIVFCTEQHGGTQLQASWRVFRTFDEFQGLDTQLRRAFPQDMHSVARPPPHRRRTWLHRHRSAKFLAKRCAELNLYLECLVRSPHLRLTRFLDPRAPLVLRCFCNFDAGLLAAEVTVVRNPVRNWDLYLDGNDTRNGLNNTVDDSVVRPMDENERNWRPRSRRRSRIEHHVHNVKLDELEANLIDDKSRNLIMCVKYECACRVAPFRVVYTQLLRMLQLRGWKQVYAPPNGAYTALYCVLYKLQQLNDLDKRLYDAFTGSGRSLSPIANDPDVFESGATCHEQLSVGVHYLRQTLVHYGLLHAHILANHFLMTTVDLKRRLHDLKSQRQSRVGAIELVVVATILNLSILLVTNDHEGSEHQILPLAGLRAIRPGKRIHMTFGYILPTLACVDGFYLLAERDSNRSDPASPWQIAATTRSARSRNGLWQGLDEMDRQFMVEIERTISNAPVWEFDCSIAESLNSAILDAVWDDCHHNPSLFSRFQRHARDFGKGITSARHFMQYLEVAFGLDGATYLVDFLLHVLPEKKLRTQLSHVRWMRLHVQLARRVVPDLH